MTVDYAAVTVRQQQVWSLGDYGKIGSLLSWLGESLVRELDVHPGERVLDVAAGNGNASLPALRRFADVLATDYVPELLENARRRAAADGFDLRTQVADAQALPFADGEFDVVMSTIGAMFAPDQEAVARELLRVCRPGGRIGMANRTPDSMVGDMFRVVGSRVPPPQGVRPAVAWGDEEVVRSLLGPGCSELRLQRRTCPCATRRRTPTSSTSAPGTARPSRPSPPSARTGRPTSSATCSRCSARTTSRPTARSRSR